MVMLAYTEWYEPRYFLLENVVGMLTGSSGSQICLAWSLPRRRDGNGGPQAHIKDSDIIRVSTTLSPSW